MHKIDELRQEIKSFEVEISSLEKELAAVGGRTLQLASGDSNATAISKAIRSEAQRLIQQQPVVQGLRDAIAELNSRLQPKKYSLTNLKCSN
jgi:chromosome segregation ATPase